MHDTQGFSILALGYHVVTLIFPNDLPTTACAADSEPKTFEQLRSSIIEGGRANYQNGHQELVIARAESIENRRIEVLQFFATT
jgi:hypothetical protein